MKIYCNKRDYACELDRYIGKNIYLKCTDTRYKVRGSAYVRIINDGWSTKLGGRCYIANIIPEYDLHPIHPYGEEMVRHLMADRDLVALNAFRLQDPIDCFTISEMYSVLLNER